MGNIIYQNKDNGNWFSEKVIPNNVLVGRQNKNVAQRIARAVTLKRFHDKGYNLPKNIANSKLVGCINESAGFEWRKGSKKIKGVKAIIRKFYEINPPLFKPPTNYFKGVYKNKPIVKKTVKKPDFVKTDEFLMSYEWRRTRVHALKNNNGRCELCGRSPKDGIKLHVDHIKPRKKYPELALDVNNLQVLCNECNHGKGNWDDTDWRKLN